MTVIDASLIVHALAVAEDPGPDARSALVSQPIMHGPAVLKAETISGLRGLESRGRISEAESFRALDRVRRLPVRSYPVDPFIDRIWELRRNLSVYDAWYVALAETLDTSLATLDLRLASASGPTCEFMVPPPDAGS